MRVLRNYIKELLNEEGRSFDGFKLEGLEKRECLYFNSEGLRMRGL